MSLLDFASAVWELTPLTNNANKIERIHDPGLQHAKIDILKQVCAVAAARDSWT
jgi:hypothetical protein